jgi:hypothetical protein
LDELFKVVVDYRLKVYVELYGVVFTPLPDQIVEVFNFWCVTNQILVVFRGWNENFDPV